MKLGKIKNMKESIKTIKGLYNSKDHNRHTHLIRLQIVDKCLQVVAQPSSILCVDDYPLDGVDKDFSCFVDFTNFVKVVELLDDDWITLEYDTHITMDGFKIPVADADYMDVQIFNESIVPLNATKIYEVENCDIKNVKKIMNVDRLHLYGINISDKGVCCTDSMRMYLQKKAVKYANCEYSITIPGSIVKLLPKDFIVYRNDAGAGAGYIIKVGTMYIYIDDYQDTFAKFPNFSGVIPEDARIESVVDFKMFKEYLTKVKKLKSNHVIIDISDDIDLRVMSVADDGGVAYDNILTQSKRINRIETEQIYRFDVNYLLDMLNIFNPKITHDSSICIEFNGTSRPMKIETDDRVSVLMPFRR